MDKSAHELHQLGSQLFEEGKYSEAEPILRNVISENPKYADVHNKLGIIYHLKGDFRRAAEYFNKALQLNPHYTEASLNLAITYNDMGEFKKAQEVFSLAAQRAHPDPAMIDPFVAGKIANEHFKLGNIYLDLNMNVEAAEEYRKAIRLYPRLPDVHTKLG